MAAVEFFKQQAKRFLKDYNSRVYDETQGVYKYAPRFFNDIDDIIVDYDIPEDGSFTLMNAQHIIALLAGFRKWNDLIKASDAKLEIGMLLITNRESYRDKPQCLGDIVDDWEMYESDNLTNFDDESKLKIFKEVFLSDEFDKEEAKESRNRKVRLNFTHDAIAQDMLCKLMREKNLSPEKAILSSIIQKNCIKVLSTGWADIALSLWGHADWGANDYKTEQLENPIIEIKLNAQKAELINIISNASDVTDQTAILYCMLFALESLGYHI